MGTDLFEKFTEQFDLLAGLFPKGHFTPERIRWLDEIYRACKDKWEENLLRLSGREVHYILIGEAPPWTQSGPVRYFYNTCDGPWVNRLWRTFFPDSKTVYAEKALADFARVGFLLIDALPFAENYSGRRHPVRYPRLVGSCLPYLLGKIHDSRLRYASQVSLALAFKVNGRAIIDSLQDGICLPTGQRLDVTSEIICADGSGYTSPKLLRSVFGLDEFHGENSYRKRPSR